MHLPDDYVSRPTDPDALVLEAWGQGLMIGSLVVMAATIVSNMRSHILLHKLILAELVLAIPNGFFIFNKPPVYGWYLSATAIGLNISWTLHNVIAWMKSKRFYSRRVSQVYIITVILVQPYWVLEIYANFTYFNNINQIYRTTRPLEPFFRDPWWIYTTCHLFYTIKWVYTFGIFELVTVSPRFGVMLAAMCLSIVFIIVDTCSVLGVFGIISHPVGIEPFWKISFIFKCLCNTIILDDFETALDRIRAYRVMKQARMSAASCRTPAENNVHPRYSAGQPTSPLSPISPISPTSPGSPTSPDGAYFIEVGNLTRPEQARGGEERSNFSV